MLADIREVFDPAPAGPAWSYVPRDLRSAQTINGGHDNLAVARCFFSANVEAALDLLLTSNS